MCIPGSTTPSAIPIGNPVSIYAVMQQIVNVKRDTIGSKNDKKIRTVVIFDDGFEYVSHKTDRENHLLSYRIQVTESTAKEILEDAMEAHQKACNKANK